MAFTNPIVAGTELKRTDVRSDNYVEGVSGWILKRNGGAEFGNLQVRQDLTVGNSISLQGKDLATLLNTRALGCVAWMRGFPTTSTTGEDAVMWTEVDVIAGRLYEVSLMNITPDIANPNQAEFAIRYLTGTSAWPTNATPQLAISLRLSQFQLGFIRAYYLASVNTRLRLRASIRSLDGATVRSWGPGDGAVLAVNDLGVGPALNGSASNVVPGKTLKEYTHSTSACARYAGNGSSLQNPGNNMSQGDFSDSFGDQRSWAIFDATALNDINDFVGVPFADVVVAEAYFEFWEWRTGQGAITLGYHNKTSLPVGNEQSGGVPAKIVEAYSSTGGKWIDLKSYGNATGSFMEALRTGYFKGFMTGSFSTAPLYCGRAFHIPAFRPALHLKYYK